MTKLILAILAIIGFELPGLIRKKQKKDMLIFIIIVVLTFSLGWFYISNPYRTSLTQQLLNLFGISS